MQKIKTMLATFLLSFNIAVPAMVLSAPVATFAQSAQIQREVCEGVTGTTGDRTAECADPDDDSFFVLLQNIINIFSIVVGAISVIMIIIGGFRYITSAGDSNGVSAAKNTILYALVGLVIVIFAQTIVRFVIGQLGDGT